MKALHVSIIVNFIVVAWAVLVTSLYVKFDRKHDRLTGQIKSLGDTIRVRNQAISQLEYDKLVLQEEAALLRQGINAHVKKVTKNRWIFYIK